MVTPIIARLFTAAGAPATGLVTASAIVPPTRFRSGLPNNGPPGVCVLALEVFAGVEESGRRSHL